MKKPVVDYRSFRPSLINEPQFSHLKLLLGWIGYFVLFILTENLIPEESCHVIYSPLDDLFPFCELFVIPYVFWYIFVAGSLLYFLLYNVDSFKKLQIFIIITQVAAMAAYIIYPSVQYLRPEVYPRDNFLTDIVALIQTIDTPTGVCPSLHVAYSIAVASVWLKERGVSALCKVFVVITAVLICLSTLYIKQHSVIDFFAAIPVCLLAEIVVYRKYWFKGEKQK